MLSLTTSNGTKSSDAMTLSPGQSPQSAALAFMRKHNVNGNELVSLSNTLLRELQRAHPTVEDHGTLGVQVFPSYESEARHASRAESLVDDGNFEEAAIHLALAAHLATQQASEASASDSAATVETQREGEDGTPQPSTDVRVRQYHDSVTKIISVLREVADREEAVEDLLRAGKWSEALSAISSAKAAGGTLHACLLGRQVLACAILVESLCVSCPRMVADH